MGRRRNAARTGLWRAPVMRSGAQRQVAQQARSPSSRGSTWITPYGIRSHHGGGTGDAALAVLAERQAQADPAHRAGAVAFATELRAASGDPAGGADLRVYVGGAAG